MNSEPPSPLPNESLWRSAIGLVWRDMDVAQHPHPDAEELAAYAEGRLSEVARAACEEHLSRCPSCLELACRVGELNAQTSPPRFQPLKPAAWRRRLIRLATAACLLLGMTGLGWWGLGQYWLAQRSQQQVTDLEQRLADAQLQLAGNEKEAYLALAPSSARAFWSGTTSAHTLELPLARGDGRVDPEAQDHASRARQILEQLAQTPSHRGQALLELASLDIAGKQLEQADERLRQALDLLGDTPEATNIRGVWHLAKGDERSTRQAEEVLRDLTRRHPDYLPAWYNLALLLEQGFRDDESRKVWEEYLHREQRPEYRKAAEEHLAALGG